ncbi:hypothetical protein [Mesorhizobium huakuii]|uniref:Response regulatory domain-containing protein n=1 Tax=Mesorhizobium huakuii TaxID=28104 RepID=A0A7G6SQ22_9HYPH|nr:hypothetical protein [Mesorhizobium huakuii]QND56604.1 hypothetical protein HB778_08255 [Mesorhizobium huakuii]
MTGQPEVNTALIIIDGDLYDVWSAMLVSAAPGVKISRADPSIFVSDKQVIETLNKRYDCILLASKLPAFSSVRLAELAHQLNSPTKLILISRNNADPEATGRLFHAFIPVEKLSSDRLSEALKKIV